MAKLTKCKDCGSQVSKNAEACPQCGAKLKRKPLGCGALLAILIAAGIWVSVFENAEPPATQKVEKLPTSPEAKQALEAKLLAELKTIPAKQLEDNKTRYQKLSTMFPDNSGYKKKLQHYQAQIKRQKQIEGQFSQWDGSHKALASYVEENMKNPDSFEHVKTVYFDKGDKILIEMRYRGTNSFGAVTTETAYAEASIDGTNVSLISR